MSQQYLRQLIPCLLSGSMRCTNRVTLEFIVVPAATLRGLTLTTMRVLGRDRLTGGRLGAHRLEAHQLRVTGESRITRGSVVRAFPLHD